MATVRKAKHAKPVTVKNACSKAKEVVASIAKANTPAPKIPKHKTIKNASIALFIDGENMSSFASEQIFSRIKQYGLIRYKVIYSITPTSRWGSKVEQYGLEVVQAPRAVKGKNADDIAITTKIADMCHTFPEIDTFAVASSDSDFMALAQYVRSLGKDFIGIGYDKTPATYRKACSDFVELTPKEKTQNDENRQKQQAKARAAEMEKAVKKNNTRYQVGSKNYCRYVNSKVRAFVAKQDGGITTTTRVSNYVSQAFGITNLGIIKQGKMTTYLKNLGFYVKEGKVWATKEQFAKAS